MYYVGGTASEATDLPLWNEDAAGAVDVLTQHTYKRRSKLSVNTDAALSSLF